MDANSWTSACLCGCVDVCVDAFLVECMFAWTLSLTSACLHGCFLGQVHVCVDAFLVECMFVWTLSLTSACLRGRFLGQVHVCVDAFSDECVFAWTHACLRGCFLGRVRVFLSEFFFCGRVRGYFLVFLSFINSQPQLRLTKFQLSTIFRS